MAPTLPTPTTRRLRGLVRDDGALRATLAEKEVEAESEVLVAAVNNALETATALYLDNRYWQGLAKAGQQDLSREDLIRLDSWDVDGLAELLAWAGYTSPPPPPVEDTANRAVTAIQQANRLHQLHPLSEGLIASARAELGTALLRIRRQVARPAPEHTVGGVGRDLVEIVRDEIVPLALSSLTELVVPIPIVNKLAGAAVERTYVRLSAAAARAHQAEHGGRQVRTPDDDPSTLGFGDPLLVHSLALRNELRELRLTDRLGTGDRRPGRHARMQAIHRQLERLAELADDAGVTEQCQASRDQALRSVNDLLPLVDRPESISKKATAAESRVVTYCGDLLAAAEAVSAAEAALS